MKSQGGNNQEKTEPHLSLLQFWLVLPVGLKIATLIGGNFLLASCAQAIVIATSGHWAEVVEKKRLENEGVFVFIRWFLWQDTETETWYTPWHRHTAIMIYFLLVAAIFVLGVWARVRENQKMNGLATVGELLPVMGEKALLTKFGPALRALPKEQLQPTDCGFRLGYVGRKKDVYIRMEDPTIIIGPSRSGKGFYFVLNWILQAPGALITSSSKMDNVKLTMKHRERLFPDGRVYIFAPGVEGGDAFGHLFRWNPVAGCEVEETLIRRIHAFIPSDAFSGSTSNGGHWDTLGQQLSACLFHAAACAGKDVETVWEWVNNIQLVPFAVDAIRQHPQGLNEYADFLEEVFGMPGEQRAIQWAVLKTSLAFLSTRANRAWLQPKEGEQFSFYRFFLSASTLYLVGDKSSTGGYKRLIDGVLAEADFVSKAIADASETGRCEPPVSYILDEAGNFEYQGLYELITAGGGRGRVGVVVFQAKEQLSQWGQGEAKTLWDAAVAKIILPGGADEQELSQMSRLIGQTRRMREQVSHTDRGVSVSFSADERPVFAPEKIRQMDTGVAIVFYRNLPAALVRLYAFTKNPLYGQCQRDQQVLGVESRQWMLEKHPELHQEGGVR